VARGWQRRRTRTSTRGPRPPALAGAPRHIFHRQTVAEPAPDIAGRAAHDGRTTPACGPLGSQGTGGISPRWPSHWRPAPPACSCTRRVARCHRIISCLLLHCCLYTTLQMGTPAIYTAPIGVPIQSFNNTCYLSQQTTHSLSSPLLTWEHPIQPTTLRDCNMKLLAGGQRRRQRGFGKALKEQRARLYIIQRCVVMLLRWHD
jgi:hypothetical protein